LQELQEPVTPSPSPTSSSNGTWDELSMLVQEPFLNASQIIMDINPLQDKLMIQLFEHSYLEYLNVPWHEWLTLDTPTNYTDWNLTDVRTWLVNYIEYHNKVKDLIN